MAAAQPYSSPARTGTPHDIVAIGLKRAWPMLLQPCKSADTLVSWCPGTVDRSTLAMAPLLILIFITEL